LRAPSTFTTQHCARSVTDGQLRNPSFADYKIPGIRDMPEFLTGESVAARQGSGPYGAKGVGETGTFGGVGGSIRVEIPPPVLATPR
jgi:hypothetical protein